MRTLSFPFDYMKDHPIRKPRSPYDNEHGLAWRFFASNVSFEEFVMIDDQKIILSSPRRGYGSA